LTVLGGGSPYTTVLSDALAAAASSGGLEPRELRLHGRTTRTLELVAAHARYRLDPLGWHVSATTDRRSALDGADLVLHQPRYGGLEGRFEGEQLARRFGVAADETVGPAALATALASAIALRRLAADLVERCPHALVVNLTNPLGLVVSMLHSFGLSRCVGLCELPVTTARSLARILGVPVERLGWSYTGLSHRGFLHELRVDGVDALPRLVDTLTTHAYDGLSAAEVHALGAVPLPGFDVARGRSIPRPRARFLASLREEVVRELTDDPTRTPPSLARRRVDWYVESVVPFLVALEAGDGRLVTVDRHVDGVTVEQRAAVVPDGLVPVVAPDASEAVTHWISIFARHERCALEACLEPSPETIRVALHHDPSVPPDRVRPLADALAATLQQDSRRRTARSALRSATSAVDVRVCVQAGGRGERLRPLTDTTPKTLLRVGPASILERLLRRLHEEGFRAFTIVANWEAGQVERAVHAIAADLEGAAVDVLREAEPLGNAGALGLLPVDAPTLLVFGDLVTTMDTRHLLAEHDRLGADVTMASHFERHTLQFGEIVVDDGRVLSYDEKPTKSYRVCSGVVVLEPPALRLAATLPTPFGVSTLVSAVLEHGLEVAHWEHGAEWVDVNSPEALQEASRLCTADHELGPAPAAVGGGR
jgi:6-phospho-beta-glucosidase